MSDETNDWKSNNDWARDPSGHAPYHYWLWNDSDQEQSRKRLGQRMYIIACLMWSAKHDQKVGQELRPTHPNWSAVASYYSMVHSLRLFWFVLYGSYPTGHVPLQRVLTRTDNGNCHCAVTTWSPGPKFSEYSFPKSKCAITTDQLDDALSRGLGCKDLAGGRMQSIGSFVNRARVLRCDSNYESLILAHQFFHTNVNSKSVNDASEFSIVERMNKLGDILGRGSIAVNRYVQEVVKAAMVDSREWFCKTTFYAGEALGISDQ